MGQELRIQNAVQEVQEHGPRQLVLEPCGLAPGCALPSSFGCCSLRRR
jgi:hypothetical protein